MNSQKIKAFTLVELIIVITILTILSTIGFMSYQGYSEEARDGKRITNLKDIQTALNISYTKNQIYPNPDKYIDVVGVSKQGYIGEEIKKKLKASGIFKDPKDDIDYLYNLDYTGKKIQLSGFLENNNKILLSNNNIDYVFNKNFLDNLSFNKYIKEVIAGNINYSKRYIYTVGDRIGILLDETTNTPVNEILNGTGTLNLNTDSGSYTAVFTNDSTNSGTITGTGINLLNDIVVVQNSCILGSSVITSGQQISAYNKNSVAYNQTCTPIIRSCNNGVLSGDANYKYDTCSPIAALNCTANTYNGYNIPVINHNANQNITKNITGGVADINASCVNGVLTYGTENINCSINYVLDGGICKEDLCTGNAPDFSIVNGTQKYNNPWLHNTTAGICTFICQAGYYYNTNLCNAASIGNYVGTSGLTNQTACSANDKYQDTTGQTSCKNVSAGYYSTPIGNVAHTGQTQCEANNYCVSGVKYACPAGYSSPAGSSSAGACIKNTWSTGSYGSCSVSCGGGTQSRTVICKDYLGNTLSDSKCIDSKPITSQSCNTQSCCRANMGNSCTYSQTVSCSSSCVWRASQPGTYGGKSQHNFSCGCSTQIDTWGTVVGLVYQGACSGISTSCNINKTGTIQCNGTCQ